MAIVKLKTKDEKVNELLGMFKLPGTGYVKPRPEPVGGSAVNSNSVEDKTRLHAINQLRRWMKPG